MGFSWRSLLGGGRVRPDARSLRSGLKVKDLELLGALQAEGADLTAPRHVLHCLYFPTGETASLARDEIARASWQVQVREPLPEFPDQWLVLAERPAAVLTPDFVRETTDFMEAVAARHGGEHDGWEAGAEPA